MRLVGWVVRALLIFGFACGGQAGGGTDGSTGGGQGGGAGGTGGGTGQTFAFPTAPGWTFFGPANGGPHDVWDAAYDEGGNLWVAGGTEGLFVMRAGSSTFEKFGIADGLHPYGWLNGDVAKSYGVPDGSPADTKPSLEATPVIAVAGGPAGTVFVGYQGKPGCESAWSWDKSSAPSTWGDAAVYKSGDADRVTLKGSGIDVVHYDIFSGPGVVGGELGGREKICTVHRIAWDKAKDLVWFGGNHGFAVAKADAPNTPACNGAYPGATNPGNCAVVWEHSHPAISGCGTELASGGCSQTWWLTDAYFGVAVDPSNHDAWMGGQNRSTKFHLGSYGGGLSAFYQAADDTEWPAGRACPHALSCGMSNRWDLWPDQVPEWDSKHGIHYVTPLQRSTPGASKPDYALDDDVSGVAALPDGTAWFGSFSHGLVRVDSYGSILADATSKIMTKYVSSVAYDPTGSVWAGMEWGGGISRVYLSGGVTNYSWGAPYDPNATFGDKLANAPVANIQSAGSGSGRRMVAAFRQFTMKDPTTNQPVTYAGAVGVYSGN